MKTIITTILLSVLTLAAFTQSKEQQIIDLLRSNGFSVSTTQSVRLAQGEGGYYWKTFYSGNNYFIVAFSEDSDVNDIDLYLYDSDGTLLIEDKDTKPVAVLDFNVHKQKDLKVVIKNYNSDLTSYEYPCKFIIFYK